MIKNDFDDVTSPELMELKECAMEGDVDAQHWLGRAYFKGRYGLKIDIERSEFWFEQAINKMKSTIEILNAHGLSRLNLEDLTEKLDLFSYSLALSYWVGGKKSLSMSIVNKLVEKDYPPALYFLGREKYSIGMQSEGVLLLERSAGAGHIEAKLFLKQLQINNSKGILERLKLKKELFLLTIEQEEMIEADSESNTYSKYLFF